MVACAGAIVPPVRPFGWTFTARSREGVVVVRVTKSALTLEAKIVAEPGAGRALQVEAMNGAPSPATITTHARYLLIEVENETGQFVRGVPAAGGEVPAGMMSMPRRQDYLTVAPGAAAIVLRSAIERAATSPGQVTIGELTFSEVAARPRVRVTYHAADRVMPNLPRDEQKRFVAGPLSAEAKLLEDAG